MNPRLVKPVVLLGALVAVFFTLLATAKYFHLLSTVQVARYDYPSPDNWNVDVVSEIRDSLSVDDIQNDLNVLIAELPDTRTYESANGEKTARYFHKELSKYASKFVTVNEFKHPWKMSSLIVNVRGPSANDEIVVVGCHIDSINTEISHHMSPGVDDNLSGVVVALNLLKAVTQNEGLFLGFKRQLEFHFYAAEEYASLGSLDVFRHYKAENKRIVGMIQLDMTGYTEGSTQKGIQPHFGLVNDYSSQSLVEFTKLLITKYCSIPARDTHCGKICSDNAAALAYGYPSVYPLESEVDLANPFRHTIKDTIDLIDFNHIWQHWALALAFSLELTLTQNIHEASSPETFTFKWIDFGILELVHEPKRFVYLSVVFAAIVGTLYYIYLEIADPVPIKKLTEELPLESHRVRKMT